MKLYFDHITSIFLVYILNAVLISRQHKLVLNLNPIVMMGK